MLLPGKFLFLLAVALEVVATLLVAQQVGVLWTFVWFVASIVAGVVVIKRAGSRAWDTMRGASRQPGQAAGDTPLLFAAGLLLIVPGILSDLLGVFLLIPASRAFAKARMVRLVSRRVTIVQGAASQVWPRQDVPPDVGQAGELIDEDREQRPDGL